MTARTGEWSFTGTLRWSADVDVPGCIALINTQGADQLRLT